MIEFNVSENKNNFQNCSNCLPLLIAKNYHEDIICSRSELILIVSNSDLIQSENWLYLYLLVFMREKFRRLFMYLYRDLNIETVPRT